MNERDAADLEVIGSDVVVPVDSIGLAVVGDATGPVVLGTTPALGASGVPTGGPLAAYLSTDVVADSIRCDHHGVEVSGRGSFDPLDRAYRFVPSFGLAPGARYSVALWGATDRDGRIMGTCWWHFTTAGQSPLAG
jgi:hypothetical protein